MTAAASSSSLAEVERSLRGLLLAADRGDRPSRERVAQLRTELARLRRTDPRATAWRLAEIDELVREVSRRALPPEPMRSPAPRPGVSSPAAGLSVPGARSSPVAPGVPVPAPRSSPEGTARSHEVAGRFAALRRRVDALHDLVEAGRRPTRETFDEVHAALVAHRREDDGPEIRQMIDDVRGFRRRVLAASRTSVPPRLRSSRAGRGFWGRPVAERPERRRRRSERRSPLRAPEPEQPSAPAVERARLQCESRDLRERAARYAAAVPQGRAFPLAETERLFLRFKNLWPHLDRETQALNDAAVRGLVAAVREVRARRESGDGDAGGLRR